MRKFSQLLIGVFFASIMLVSCIKDTTFDNADEIALTPIVESNFIYFNLNGSDFYDSQNNLPKLILRDTTEIRFLDDSGFQDALKRAEFYFKYTNSIPKQFNVTYRFLSKTSDTTYTFENTVAPGSLETAVITERTKSIVGEELINFTTANRVVVIVTIPSSDENISGILNLQSKGTFYLEY